MNVRDQFDQAIDALGKISLMAQLRDMVVIALAADRRRCGNCQLWMKSRLCPAERNIGGMSRGPSADAPACGQFQITQRALDLKSQRFGEAVAFAEAHELPVPAILRTKGAA